MLTSTPEDRKARLRVRNQGQTLALAETNTTHLFLCCQVTDITFCSKKVTHKKNGARVQVVTTVSHPILKTCLSF
jgi:hypothetical protein